MNSGCYAFAALGDGDRGGVREPVGRADDERLEHVFGLSRLPSLVPRGLLSAGSPPVDGRAPLSPPRICIGSSRRSWPIRVGRSRAALVVPQPGGVGGHPVRGGVVGRRRALTIGSRSAARAAGGPRAHRIGRRGERRRQVRRLRHRGRRRLRGAGSRRALPGRPGGRHAAGVRGGRRRPLRGAVRVRVGDVPERRPLLRRIA